MLSIDSWKKATQWPKSCDCNWYTLFILYENMRTSFLGSSIRWSRESQNLQLFSSETFLNAGGSRNLLFAEFVWNQWPLLIWSVFDVPEVVKSFDPSEEIGACPGGHLISSTRVTINGCYGLPMNVPGYTFNFSWTLEVELPIFLFWRIVKRCIIHFRNLENVKNLQT